MAPFPVGSLVIRVSGFIQAVVFNAFFTQTITYVFRFGYCMLASLTSSQLHPRNWITVPARNFGIYML